MTGIAIILLVLFVLSVLMVIFTVFSAMLIAVLGLLRAPFAARMCRRKADENGLDPDYYALLGAIYSFHFLMTWSYLKHWMEDRRTQPPSYFRLFFFWFFVSIFWHIVTGYLLAGAIDQQMERQNIGWQDWDILIILPLVVVTPLAINIYLWVKSVQGVKIQRALDLLADGRTRGETLPVDDYRIPLVLIGVAAIVLMAMAFSVPAGSVIYLVVPFVAIVGLPTAIVIIAWNSLVDRANGEMWQSRNRPSEKGDIITPLATPYLRPFAYGFMGMMLSQATGWAMLISAAAAMPQLSLV